MHSHLGVSRRTSKPTTRPKHLSKCSQHRRAQQRRLSHMTTNRRKASSLSAQSRSFSHKHHPSNTSNHTFPISSRRAFVAPPLVRSFHSGCKTKAAEKLRELEITWMKLRVARPFVNGMTSQGMHYIDTRPTASDNNHTVLTTFEQFAEQFSQEQSSGTFSVPKPFPRHEPAAPGTPGVTIVLAHGYSLGLGMWNENFDFLSSLPNVNRVVAIDWRGMGASDRSDDGPLRSSFSALEEYRYEHLGISPQTDEIQRTRSRVQQFKREQCLKQLRLLWPGMCPHGDFTEPANDQSSPLSVETTTPRSHLQALVNQRVYHTPDSFTPQEAVDYFIDPLLHLWKDLRLDTQPVILVGHSLGAYLSANFVHKYPGLVQSLVLASPAGVCESFGLHETHELKMLQQLSISPLTVDTISESLSQQHHLSSSSSASSSSPPPSSSSSSSSSPLPPGIDRPYFAASQSEAATTPSSSSTDQTPPSQLDFSISRLKRPLILRHPIINIIDWLWKTNHTPQSILRPLPKRVSLRFAQSLASRMYPPGHLPNDHLQYYIDYLHHLLTAPSSGEHALNSLLHIDYPSFRAQHEWNEYKALKSAREATEAANIAKKAARADSLELISSQHPQTKVSSQRQSQPSLSPDTSTKTHIESTTDAAVDRIISNHSSSTVPSSTSAPVPPDQPALQSDDTSLPTREMITPSVFARKPLSDVLFDINCPMHFIYGDTDWLFHHDVPYIVGSLHQHFSHKTTHAFLTRKSLNVMSGLHDVENVFGPHALSSSSSSSPSPSPSSTSTPSTVTSHPAEYSSQYISNMLHFDPSITLSVLPQAGHHLYANNIKAFHMTVNEIVKEFNTKIASNMATHGPNTFFDPQLTSSALHNYLEVYDNAVHTAAAAAAAAAAQSKCRRFTFVNFDVMKKRRQKGTTPTTDLSVSEPSPLGQQEHPNGPETSESTAKTILGAIFRDLFSSSTTVPTTTTPTTTSSYHPQHDNTQHRPHLFDIHMNPQRTEPLQEAQQLSLLPPPSSAQLPRGTLKTNICTYAKMLFQQKDHRYKGVQTPYQQLQQQSRHQQQKQ